jgi:glycosyltransferase involved in cell wall biosynthesis
MHPSKIALIIQRFGDEINGGAEVHCKKIAIHLTKQYEVEILTTCAKDYRTWKPEFKPGVFEQNGILVRRFWNLNAATKSKLRFIRHKITGRLLKQKIARWLGLKPLFEKWFPSTLISENDYQKWLEYQGPFCPDLIQYLHEHSDEYIALIFFTAIYYPAATGVMQFSRKSILIPMIHDEKSNYYKVYHSVLNAPEWIFYNSFTEKLFSEKLYNNTAKKNSVVGLGVELPFLEKENSFLLKCKIMDPYILYVGRIEKGKGCSELIDHFLRYKNQENTKLKLVMVGEAFMPLIKNKNIIFTGFVSEMDKFQLLLNCEILMIPSKYESLSIVLLEGFYYQKPAMVNANCAVLKSHITESNGGYFYSSFQEFQLYLKQLLSNEILKNTFGINGRKYVLTNYSWEAIFSKYETAISDIKQLINSKD